MAMTWIVSTVGKSNSNQYILWYFIDEITLKFFKLDLNVHDSTVPGYIGAKFDNFSKLASLNT